MHRRSRSHTSRRRLLLAISAAVVLCLLVLGLAMWWPRGGRAHTSVGTTSASTTGAPASASSPPCPPVMSPTVGKLTATPDAQSPGSYGVDASGSFTNTSGYGVTLRDLSVTYTTTSGQQARLLGTFAQNHLNPGEKTQWSASGILVASSDRPSHGASADAWYDYDVPVLSGCGHAVPQ
jgi:hypothetical protein